VIDGGWIQTGLLRGGGGGEGVGGFFISTYCLLFGGYMGGNIMGA